MRFLTPPQTLSEYRHQKMPVYETLAAIGATTIVGSLTVGGLAAGAATAGAGALAAYGVNAALGSHGGGGGGGGGYGSAGGYQPFTTEDQIKAAEKLFQQAQQSGIDFSKIGTQANIANQNMVTPGSKAQRILAQNQLNSYIQGQVPLDVQQNAQRAMAQSLGGGYNPFTGGGQAPSAFARNIGQTSLGLSQYGLSAAPTWQQLANSMVVSPSVGMEGQLRAQQTAGGLGMQNTENQYQAGMNQYAQQQLQQQQQSNLLMGGANMGLGLMNSVNKAGYLGNLSGYTGTSSAPTVGGYFSSLIPSYSGAEAMAGQYQIPAGVGTGA